MPMKVETFFTQSFEPAFYTDTDMLIWGDSFQVLPVMKPGSIDMVFADPPYFLSNDGFTCQGGKMVSVNKGEWDKVSSLEEKHAFNRRWIRLCKTVLTPNGTIWISGTLHNIFSIGMALEQEGFKIMNNITWQKTNPPPNLSCRYFTHSTETVIWARKAGNGVRHVFNYEWAKAQCGGHQMKDVWTGPLTPMREKLQGKHPTQKPLYLLQRIIQASTYPGATILDPFCGSSTTGVAAKQLGRNYIGIDKEREYIALSIRRLLAEGQP